MPGTFQRPPVMRVTLDQLQPVQRALAAALQTRFNQHNASDVRPDGSPCPCEHCTDLRWVLYQRTLVRLSNSSERARPCTPARDQAPPPTVHAREAEDDYEDRVANHANLVCWLRNYAEEILAALESQLSPQASAPESAPRAASAPAAAVPSPPAEPLSARLAANQPLIRRMLLDAWHDLRWYRVNAKEHPGHAGRTVEALQAALKSGDDVHYAKIAEECAGAKFAAECSTETHNMACESIAQAIRQCDHVPAPGASRAPADAAGTCIFCSIWDRYTQGILMAWSERAEDDDEREEIVAWRQKVRTLATRAPASASPTSSDADAAEPARETEA